MGQKAIYHFIEQGKDCWFYAHWGANALSPLLRLLQAKELQARLPEQPDIAHVFEHLDYSGQYVNPRLDAPDMFCERIDPAAVSDYVRMYEKSGELEMRITLDLDHNNCLLEYNRNCPWYAAMANYTTSLDTGLSNVEKLLALAEKRGVTDFGQLLTLYHKATGLEDALDKSRASERLNDYLQSDGAREARARFQAMFGSEADAEENEDMEV